MSEYKTTDTLIIEAYVRAVRWQKFRHIVYVTCAIVVTASLIWIAYRA